MEHSTNPAVPILGILGPITPLEAPPLPQASCAQINRLLEFVLYLTLHGDVALRAFDQAFFPDTVHADVYRYRLGRLARTWLGPNHLPPRQRHRLHLEQVTTDWHRFQTLLAAGRRGAALRLVRGQPLTGLSGASSGWAEPWQATLIATVHATGLGYARDQLRAGDLSEARIGVAGALAAEPASEPAYRVAETVANRAEDEEGLRHTRRRRRRHREVLHAPNPPQTSHI